MDYVKPSSMLIHAEFRCPDCSFSSWLTKEQYSHPDYFIICGVCHKQFKPQILLKRDSGPTIPRVAPPAIPTNNSTLKEALSILVNQGFESKNIIGVIKTHNISGDRDTVISKILQYL